MFPKVDTKKALALAISFILLFVSVIIPIFYYMYTVKGDAPFSENKIVNNDTADATQNAPSMAVDATGTVYIAWEDNRRGDMDIFFSKSLDGGETWTSDVKISTDINNETQSAPSLAVDADGDIYVVWQDDRNGDWDIYFAKSENGGNSWTNPNIKISTDDTNLSQQYPSLTVDSSGNLYTIWADQRWGNWDIYFAKSINGGITWIESDTPINSDALGTTQINPDIAVDSTGTLYAAWQDNIDGDYDIHFANSTNGGTSWSLPNKKINTEASGQDQYNPSIDAGTTGKVYLAWEDYRNDATNADIYFAKSTDGGGSWTKSIAPISTDPTNSHQTYPSLVLGPTGTIYVAWQDIRSGSDYDIYFTYSIDQGGSWIYPNLRVNDDPVGKAQDLPTIGVGATSNVHVAWADYRNDHYDIYSAYIGSVNPFPTAESLKVEGFSESTPGIMHIIPDRPTFSFVYNDPNNDPLAQYDVSVWDAGGSTLLWECNRTHTIASGETVSVTYNTAPCPETGPSLVNGTTYVLRVSVMNDTGIWGPESEVEFHMNEVLTPLSPVSPADNSLILASATQIVKWTPPGADAEGDSINFSWEVATDSAFSNVIASGFGPENESDPFDTRPSGHFYWRVNLTDGWETGSFGNPPDGYWNFTTYSGSVPNNPPVITNKDSAPQSAFEGIALVFTFTATDEDEDPLTWSKISGPDWLQIGPANGTIYGTPSSADIGSNTFKIEVSDGKDGKDNHTFTIEVDIPSATNNPPVITNKDSAPDSAAVNSSLSFKFLATDDDNDPLTWSKISGPDWLQIGPANGTIYGTPSSDDYGDNEFTIQVIDGKGGEDSHTFTIVVDGDSDDDDDGPLDFDDSPLCLILIIIIVLVILILLFLWRKKKKKEEIKPSESSTEPPREIEESPEDEISRPEEDESPSPFSDEELPPPEDEELPPPDDE
ncbi:MAG: BNR-4 repeat-containing protein [Methanomassiliicoccales archaeon]|nr:MAG: BNR-4 repeat-containing protein [Methanomassiliicoccales archaeon]